MSTLSAVVSEAVGRPSPAPAPLRLTDVTWHPHSRREPTIDRLTLDIPAGQTVLLAGASGSGKSTVLRALAGLLDPAEGDLRGTVHGPELRALMVQQPEDAVVASTVERDIAFGPENRQCSRPAIHRRVEEGRSRIAADVPAGSGTLAISGGQLQRVSLAGALALGAQALLLDEPASQLDPTSADRVREAVLAAREGRTVVIADHDVERWADAADRIVLLGPQARILADGPPERVLAQRPELRRAQRSGTTIRDYSSAAPAPAPVLTLEDVALAHPDGSGRALHEHLEVTVPAGSLTAICGPSGAGKTTLLRAIVGLDEPQAGLIRRGEPEQIAYLPQNPEHVFVARTVAEEVSASPRATDPRLAAQLLEEMDLAHLAAASPFALSGGEQRRLALAAALATEPDLLVLDEPTTGLDAERWQDVIALIDAARRRRCAVVVSTHDAALADHADQRLDLPRGPEPLPQRTQRRRAPSDRLNQLMMLLIGLCGMIGSFAITTPQIGVATMIPILLLAPLAIGSWKHAGVRVLPALLAMLTVGWSVVLLSGHGLTSAEGWTTAVKESLRIGALVLPGVLLLGSLDEAKLGDALGQRAHLPARPVVSAMAALAQLEGLRRTWRILLETRRLRGLAPRRSIAPVVSATAALLITALRSAGVRAMAMDARGFATAHQRTWAMPSPLTWADAVGAVIAVALLVWPWIARGWLA